MVYDKVENTSWKWINLKDPTKRLIAGMLGLIIILILSNVATVKAVVSSYDKILATKDDVITSLRNDVKDLKKENKECAEKRVQRAEKGYDKVMGIENKVDQLQQQIKEK